MPRLTAARIGLGLIAIHLVWGLARVPSRVVARRLDDVATYRRLGAAAFHLDRNRTPGAAAIEWVRQHTPPDSVVLWSGESMGALEYAPTLIAPRLLVDGRRWRPGETRYAGLPIATAERDGRRGAVVLVGRDGGIEVEVR